MDVEDCPRYHRRMPEVNEAHRRHVLGRRQHPHSRCASAAAQGRAALAAVLVRDRARELDLVHQWFDSWAGLGLVVAGMTHRGWDVQLTACAARDWRANFFPVGIAHSIVGGSAWEPTCGEQCSGRRGEALQR
jgi:hypothetical protein